MPGRCSFVAVVLVVASCDGAITLEIAGDRPIPRALDAICVGVADTDEDGGHSGQHYELTGELAKLPQTLRVEPGDASSAFLWVRGDRGGVPVSYSLARTDFGNDVRLALDKCPAGRDGSPRPFGDPVGPAGAKLVASHGSGNLVVAFASEATIIDASGGKPTIAPGLAIAGTVNAAIAIDVDGDCDDDLVVATTADAPIVWRREHKTFTLGAPIGSAPVSALAAADVDRDGDMDIVTGGGAAVALFYNDGAGRFTYDDEDLKPNGRVSSVRALALGDINTDGAPDLLVGQNKAPMTAWLGGLNGAFEENDGVIPPVPLDVGSFTLVDADGDEDLDPDLAVAVRGGPMRIYMDREGQLEDQSFVRLPRPPPIANAIAIAGWDAGKCEPDAIVASDGESTALHGEKEAFTIETMLAGATDVVIVDLDEDGDLDAVLATPEGVRWLAR